MCDSQWYLSLVIARKNRIDLLITILKKNWEKNIKIAKKENNENSPSV